MCKYICEFMGRMQIVISDQLEKELRKKAAITFGLRKGSISNAVGEAIKEWLNK